ncbi:MAG: beta-ketothiolase BktB [Candidatus Puniceispirillales bacterium]
MNQVYIVSATRSAIGSFGGTLKDMRPIDLGITIAKSAIAKSQIDKSAIQHAVIGHVIHTEAKDQYISRAISIGAGMSEQAPALTVNRLCGSGLQSIVSATQMIQLGDATAAMAGGVEVMSRGGYLLPAQRWGARMGDGKVEDMMFGALNDPFDIGHMGITAENVASDFDISRDDMDNFAAESQRRAANAQAEGWFDSQITPVEISTRKSSITFDKDEYIRGDTSSDKLGGLRPAFQKDGAVTAGNSSGINDGSAMLILASEQMVNQHGLKPLAKIVSYGFGGVAPRIMGMGPVPATKMALEKSGLTISDLDVVESNEAFAAQACAVSKALGLPSDIVNPNGGAIALGHPVGATGSILMTKLVHELHRRSQRIGLATMCIGGGQGISVIIDTSI